MAFPVWVSTSTTARWAPNGNVGLAARKSTSAASPAGPACAATSAQVSAVSGSPRTCQVPVAVSSSRSAWLASIMPAATSRAWSFTWSAAWWTAMPPSWSEREPKVPTPVGT